MEQVPPSTIAVRELVVKRPLEDVQRSRYTILKRGRCAHRQKVMNFPYRVRKLPGSHNPPDSPSRYAESLRGTADGDGALPHSGQRSKGEVLAVEANVLVDLVRDCQNIMPLAEVRDGSEL